jgi:hypothetical protein
LKTPAVYLKNKQAPATNNLSDYFFLAAAFFLGAAAFFFAAGFLDFVAIMFRYFV